MSTLLLVDDHDAIRDMMSRRLQERGFVVMTATDGLQAVLACASATPQLILMDINMPELDGIEATRQIREAHPDKSIPIIALTAHALADDEARAKAAGCNAFHPKPVNFTKLFDQIDALLGASPPT
jgi:CheY-like chemotaxis protein